MDEKQITQLTKGNQKTLQQLIKLPTQEFFTTIHQWKQEKPETFETISHQNLDLLMRLLKELQVHTPCNGCGYPHRHEPEEKPVIDICSQCPKKE